MKSCWNKLYDRAIASSAVVAPGDPAKRKLRLLKAASTGEQRSSPAHVPRVCLCPFRGLRFQNRGVSGYSQLMRFKNRVVSDHSTSCASRIGVFPTTHLPALLPISPLGAHAKAPRFASTGPHAATCKWWINLGRAGGWRSGAAGGWMWAAGCRVKEPPRRLFARRRPNQMLRFSSKLRV